MSWVLPTLGQELVQKGIGSSKNLTKRVIFIKSAKEKADDGSTRAILISTYVAKVVNGYPILLSGHIPIHGAWD